MIHPFPYHIVNDKDSLGQRIGLSLKNSELWTVWGYNKLIVVGLLTYLLTLIRLVTIATS